MADRSLFAGSGALGGVNLAIRFLLELAMLAALSVWGFRVTDPLWLRIAAGTGAPLAAAVVWGTLIAPRAPRRLNDPSRLVVELALFGMAAAALASAELPAWAIGLGTTALVNIAVVQVLRLR